MPLTRKSLVLASNNPGKIKEIQALLNDSVEVLAQSAFNVPECDETGLTFVENAILKARNAAGYCGMPVIADDSGLIVDALNGAPGVRSARYAGDHASDQENNAKLLAELALTTAQNRCARFVCVIVYLRHPNDPCPIIAEGLWYGEIAHTTIGNNGFGYDPLFRLPEFGCTSAELSSEQKNRLSHRSQALQQISAAILADMNRQSL